MSHDIKEMAARLARIEARLCQLMVFVGADPEVRYEKQANTTHLGASLGLHKPRMRAVTLN